VTAGAVPVAGSPTQVSFSAGDAATIILDTAGSRLRIVTVSPHPGWSIERQEHDSATTIEVRLESASGEVRFDASLVRGVVLTDVDRRGDDDSSGPGSGDDDDDDADADDSGSGSGSGSGSDDDSGSGSGSSGSGSDGDSNGSGSSGSGSSGSGSGSGSDD